MGRGWPIALLAWLVLPAAASADQPPPPAAPASAAPAPPAEAAPAPPAPAPPAALEFHLPEGVTPIDDPRPMRFSMSGGNRVVGRRIGEDPEFIWIVTEGRLARVRKADVSSMDYRVDEAAPVVPPPAAMPPPLVIEAREPPRRPGRGLVIWGSILFGVSYSLSVATAFEQESDSAILLAVPLVGPALFAASGDEATRDTGAFIGLSLIETAGAVMLFFGIRKMMEKPARTPRQAPLALFPVLGEGRAGLRAVGTF